MENFYLATVNDPEIGTLVYIIAAADRKQAPHLLARHYALQGWELAGLVRFERLSLQKVKRNGCAEVMRFYQHRAETKELPKGG